MLVEVKEMVEPVGMFDTIIKFSGTVVETEEEIIFGVDHRPAYELKLLLDHNNVDEEPTFAEVPDWAIVIRTPKEVGA